MIFILVNTLMGIALWGVMFWGNNRKTPGNPITPSTGSDEQQAE